MEQAPARPRAEKPKLVPMKDDIDACLNVLSREQDGLLRASSGLEDRAMTALGPLARREKAEYAQKVGEGRLAPLTHDVMEENEARLDALDVIKADLERGMHSIASGTLPDAAFVKALRGAWHIDRRQTNDDLLRLQSLRRKHAEGALLTEKEYEELNLLPTRLAAAEERLKRLRDRLHMFQGVLRQEEIELGFTSGGELTHRERIDRDSWELMKKSINSPRKDRGLVPDHREPRKVLKRQKAA